MAVTLYGKGEGWFETSPYGVMADRYGTEPRGGGFGRRQNPPPKIAMALYGKGEGWFETSPYGMR